MLHMVTQRPSWDVLTPDVCVNVWTVDQPVCSSAKMSNINNNVNRPLPVVRRPLYGRLASRPPPLITPAESPLSTCSLPRPTCITNCIKRLRWTAYCDSAGTSFDGWLCRNGTRVSGEGGSSEYMDMIWWYMLWYCVFYLIIDNRLKLVRWTVTHLKTMLSKIRYCISLYRMQFTSQKTDIVSHMHEITHSININYHVPSFDERY